MASLPATCRRMGRNFCATSTGGSSHRATSSILTASPPDFRLERREVQVFSTREVPDPKLEEKVRGTHADFLRFTSPVRSPFPENNLANARWFPARGRRAVVLLPHWNADAHRLHQRCAGCSI